MIKSNLFCFWLTLLATCFLHTSIGQQFAEKSYYLVDSLELDKLAETDRILLEKQLAIFHSTKSDTTKLLAITEVCENMLNEDWEKYNDLAYRFSTYMTEKGSDLDLVNQFYLKVLATTISNQGYLLDMQGKTDQAMKKYNESLIISSQNKDHLGASTALNNLAVSYFDLGLEDEGFFYHKKALQLRLKIGDLEKIAISINNLGSQYNQIGDVNRALSYYFASLQIYEYLNDADDICLLMNNIAWIYASQNNFEKAIQYYNRSLTISLEIDYKRLQGSSYNGLSQCYVVSNQLDKAIICSDKAIAIFEVLGHSKEICRALLQKGNLLIRTEQYKEAEEVVNRGLAVAKDLKYKEALTSAYRLLSKIALNQKKLEKSAHYVAKSFELAQELNSPRHLSNAYKHQSELYQLKGEHEKGWKAYKMFIALKDSIDNAEIEEAALLKEANYNLDIKNRKLELIEKERALLKTRETLNNYYLVGLLVLVVLILILGFLGYKYIITKNEKKELFYRDQIRIKAKEIELLSSKINIRSSIENGDFKDVNSLEGINVYLTIPLSERELNVLRELSKGSSNQQIADALFVSINTIKSHLIKIYEKLDVKNRTQAVQKINDIETAIG